jgi:hypothetical protein
MRDPTLTQARDRLRYLQQQQERGAFVAPDLRRAAEAYREARARGDAVRAVACGRRAA